MTFAGGLKIADWQPVVASHEALIDAVAVVFRVGLGAISRRRGRIPKEIDAVVDESHRAIAERELSSSGMEAAKAFGTAGVINIPEYGWSVGCIQLHARMPEHD